MADLLPTRQAPNRTSAELLRDPRYAMSRALMQQGINTSEAGPIEALARLGTAYFGKSIGDDLNNDIKAKEAATAETYARALSGGAGQQLVFDSKLNKWNDPTGEANPALMAKILGSNPETAPQGLALQMQNMNYDRTRADAKTDQAAALANALLQSGLRQNPQGGIEAIPGFGQSKGAIAADTARPMIGVKVEEQGALMPGVIQQAGGVAGATQAAAAPYVGPNAQAAAAGTLAAQNAAVPVPGAAPGTVAPAASIVPAANAAIPKIPAGYQANPAGGVMPIPGSKEATEAEATARSRNEGIASTDRLIRSIDDLIASPDRIKGTGTSSIFNAIPGSGGKTFEANLEAAKSQAFLPAVAQLKGMGQLSDAEGKKLTAAIGALDVGMREEDFLKSLNQIKADLQAARTRSGAPDQSLAAPSVARQSVQEYDYVPGKGLVPRGQ